MNRKNLNSVIWIAVIVSMLPILFYVIKFGTWKFSTNKADWGSFGDFIGGIINPLLSFLALLVTIYIAVSLNEYEDSKNKKEKAQDDVKTYLELYQYFTSAEFKEKRRVSWDMVRKIISNPEYADFIIEGNFMSRYTNREEKRKKIYEQFNNLFYESQNLSQTDFFQLESEDRHKLESIIDFFQLLAIRDVPNGNYKVCDFYYDNWRPILCWYAKKLEIIYRAHGENKQYNTPPDLRAAIHTLDSKYCVPQSTLLDIDRIDKHPIIKWYSSKRN